MKSKSLQNLLGLAMFSQALGVDYGPPQSTKMRGSVSHHSTATSKERKKRKVKNRMQRHSRRQNR